QFEITGDGVGRMFAYQPLIQIGFGGSKIVHQIRTAAQSGIDKRCLPRMMELSLRSKVQGRPIDAHSLLKRSLPLVNLPERNGGRQMRMRVVELPALFDGFEEGLLRLHRSVSLVEQNAQIEESDTTPQMVLRRETGESLLYLGEG